MDREFYVEGIVKTYFVFLEDVLWSKSVFVTGIFCILRRENIDLCFQY